MAMPRQNLQLDEIAAVERHLRSVEERGSSEASAQALAFLRSLPEGKFTSRETALSLARLAWPEHNDQPFDLSGAHGRFADFVRAKLPAALFRAAVLTDADFFRAVLEGADFSGAALQQCDFAKANLSKACFASAQAMGADFREATLAETSFAGADLSGAYFCGAHFDRTDFSRAILKETRFRYADLRSVQGLTPEQVGSICIDRDTQLPAHLLDHREPLLRTSKPH